MRKIIVLIIAILLSLTMLTSCSLLNAFLNDTCMHVDKDDDYFCDNCGDSFMDGVDIQEDDNKDDNEDDDDEENQGSNLYLDFTPSEKSLFNQTLGTTIPFIQNDEYYVEEYTFEYDDCYEQGINFYTYGNTKAEFESYKKLFSAYTYDGSENDDYGDAWYYYTAAEGFYVDLSYYLDDDEGKYVIDVYAYFLFDYDDDNNNNGNSGNGNTTYTDFTSSEKALFNQYFDTIIPFITNSDYAVEEYTFEYDDCYEQGINFYTYGNTQSEFNAYRSLFTNYTLDYSEADDYGDIWYYYTSKSDTDLFVDMSYYETVDGYVIDVYVYYLYEGNIDDNNNQGNGGSSTSDNVITNEGVGLPTGTDGIYNVDFTKADKVKDVTDQGYYLDGCPTTGSPAVLVIPIDFSDATASSKGYTIANIVQAFTGKNTDYYSVEEYYYISSYGQLDLDITVIDEWFRPQYSSSYYKNAKVNVDGESIAIGEQIIMDEALAYLSTIMDLSDYDSDNNGIIDAIILVNTVTIDDSSDFNWAFRYWNYYTDEDGYYYEYDNVSANDYLWVPYAFMHESYDEDDNVSYTDTSVMNTYTFIHEMGHILGADDYYDTEYENSDNLLAGCDVMDSMPGDHNAFTKFNLGWITSSRLVTTTTSVTLTLEDFSKNGDTIIIANNWDDKLGAYQEYYIVVYYTANGLNGTVNGNEYGYFTRDGVIVYHVNASLYCEEYDGDIYYDIYNNNTSYTGAYGYGTEDNLIEYVKSNEGNFTYIANDSLPAQTDDQGNRLAYSFTVDALTAEYATITFTKN